jgi:hypothetical protein
MQYTGMSAVTTALTLAGLIIFIIIGWEFLKSLY